MINTDIDSFFDNGSKQQEVKEPKDDLNTQSSENSEIKTEEINQGDDGQQKTETPAVEKKKDWSQQNEFKGYLDEKDKRQKLEKELEELRAKFAKSEEVKKPDAVDDPEAAIRYSENQLQQQIWNQKVGLSESILKSMGDKFSDYDEKRDLFMDLAKEDPSLAQKLRSSDNPALFAYETAKKHLKFKEFSDPDYEKNLREQIKKDILSEMNKSQDPSSKDTKSSSSPVVKGTSLTNATGSKNLYDAKSGNSLDDIFKDHPFG